MSKLVALQQSHGLVIETPVHVVGGQLLAVDEDGKLVDPSTLKRFVGYADVPERTVVPAMAGWCVVEDETEPEAVIAWRITDETTEAIVADPYGVGLVANERRRFEYRPPCAPKTRRASA
jgi:hypothetical protein